MALLIGLWFILGLKISRSVAPLLALLLTFNVGGMLSLTQMRDLADGADVYARFPPSWRSAPCSMPRSSRTTHKRLTLIFNAWVIAAIITAILGILGYFHAFPGAEVFTRYDRAMGAFQDPNVFGPYLVAPALYLLHGMPDRRTAAKRR